MKRLVFFLLLALLVARPVAAYDIENPRTVTEARFLVSFSGTVTAPPGSATLVVINESIPMNYSSSYFYQVVRASPPAYPVVLDDERNPYAMIRLENPSGVVRYEHSYVVEAKTRPVTRLPSSYTIPGEYAKYLLPSEGIESDNPEIKKLAMKITRNATTDFERLALLTRWVHENVEYDKSLAGAHMPASWVLEHKRGVCAEYATLLAAMLRSIGIPARYVSGYAYGDDGMEAHAFVEAYIGEWVPADPTWLEAGTIDATHIVSGLLAGNTISNPMIARGEHPELVDWNRNDEVVAPLYSGEGESYSSFGVVSPGRVLAPGDYFVVATVANTTSYTIMNFSLVLCRGSEDYIQEVRSSSPFMVLEPGGDGVYYALYRIDPSFPRNLVLSCPYAVYSQDGRKIENSISVMGDTSHAPTIEIEPVGESVPTGGVARVTVRVTGNVPPGTLLYCGNDHHMDRMEIEKEGEYYFFLPAGSPGSHEVYAFTSVGGGDATSYTVESPSAMDPIYSVSSPGNAIEGETVNISLVLRPTDGQETVTLLVDGVSRGRLELSTQRTVTLQVGPLSLPSGNCTGTRTIRIGVETPGGLYERNVTVTVFKKPASIETKWIPLDGEGVLVVRWDECNPAGLGARASGSYVPARTTILGGSGAYCVRIPVTDTATLEWMDPAGSWHPLEVSTGALPPTIIDRVWKPLSCVLYSLGIVIDGGECYCE